MVDALAIPVHGGVKSIAHKRGLVVLHVESLSGREEGSFSGQVEHCVSRHGQALLLLTLSEHSAVLLVEQRFIGTDAMKELERIGTVRTDEAKGAICLVGTDIMATPGNGKRISEVLANTDVTLVLAAGISYTIVLGLDKLNDTVRNLHHLFFDKNEDVESFDAVSA
jgi:aspartate kinase